MLDWVLPNKVKPGNSTTKKVECFVFSFETGRIFELRCVYENPFLRTRKQPQF